MNRFLWITLRVVLLVGVVSTAMVRAQEGAAPPASGAVIYSFADVTAKAGMSGSTRTWGSTWADFDEDRRPDLWVGRHWRQPLLLRALGGTTFQSVDSEDFRMAGIDRHACVWGEANGDGRPDLYCVRGADKGAGSGANQLFVQTGGGFVNRATGSGVSNPNGRGRTANWLDYDSDGDLDLFAGNLTRPGFPNAMFRNDRGIFTQVDGGVSRQAATVSSSWADWDLDGDPDLLVLQHSGLPALAYENVGGTFRPVHLPNVSGRSWTSGAWGDFDGDGRPDLHLVSGARSRILRNTKRGFAPVHRMRLVAGRMSVWLDVENDGDLDLYVVQGARGRRPEPGKVNHPDFLILRTATGFRTLQGESFRGATVGNGDAVSAADFDRDGRVDLFTTNGLYYWTGPNTLLQNTTTAGRWIGIDLDGRRWNPMGFGARVIVRYGRTVVRRQLTDAANYRTQSETGYVHVGLGEALAATVEVRWPDGTRDCATVAAGTITSVAHGTMRCPSA